MINFTIAKRKFVSRLCLFILFSFTLSLSNGQTALINFNSVDPPAGFVAFPAAPGSFGVEDYIMEDGLPTDSVTLDSLVFVGGVFSSDAGGGEIEFQFFDEDTVFVNSFFINLPQDGDFLWTLFPPADFNIPISGFLQTFVDTSSAANTGRGVGGQWFLSTEANITNFVGSSPGNIYNIPPDGANPRVFAVTLNSTSLPLHSTSTDACTTADAPITTTLNDAFSPILHTGELLVSINDNGGDLGQVDADFYISSTDRVDALGQHYLNRTLFIDPANNGPATVRFYILDSELQALIAASTGDLNPITDVTDLTLTKVDGVTCGATSAGSGGGTSSLVMQTGSGSYGDDWYVDFDVTGFSALSLGGGDAVLPVELSNFDIRTKENSFELNWTTASELNNRGFEIERSTDGERFEVVGYVSGLGTSNAENYYQFEDKAILKNMDYYYRLKQINYDGQSSYSNILSGIITAEKEISISPLMPNPAFQKTSINVTLGKADDLQVAIIDLAGKVHSLSTYQLASGFHTIDLDLRSLAKGSYVVKISGQNQNFVQKLITQ